ncbi:hypothetical protein ULG90_11675 [Halopseudomonas pachastrellae]|nr:hypothetical protein ULG90_11675 [Halopseudomonas pachastrellae]
MASVADTSAQLEQILSEKPLRPEKRHARPCQLDPAINELRDTLAELRNLTRRLQDDPARFLLGRDQRQEFPAMTIRHLTAACCWPARCQPAPCCPTASR